MSTNGYIWSTSDASDNIKMKGFSFLAGATVTVEFDPVNKKLVYTHEGNNMTFEQNIELGKSAVGNIHFCANLCSKDDEIRIV
jgi:lipopolysaccharide export system protein LptA